MRKIPLYKCLTKLTLCHNLWGQSKSSLDSRIKQKRGDLKEEPTEQADFKIYCDYFDAGQSENLNPLESNPKEYLNYRSTDGAEVKPGQYTLPRNMLLQGVHQTRIIYQLILHLIGYQPLSRYMHE